MSLVFRAHGNNKYLLVELRWIPTSYRLLYSNNTTIPNCKVEKCKEDRQIGHVLNSSKIHLRYLPDIRGVLEGPHVQGSLEALGSTAGL